jgi:solute carrier family 35 protein F1/2
MECLAEGPNPLKGDLFVIAGAMLYAVSNVTEVIANL